MFRSIPREADMAAHSRMVMTENGPAVQLQVTPVFQTAGIQRPKVNLSMIPGAN